MDWITQLDINVLMFIQEHLRSDIWTPFWQLLSFLGDKGIFWIITALVLLIPKKTRRVGFAAGVSMAICYITANLVLKNAVARIRPYDLYNALTILVEKQKDFSWPSGHTVNGFSCALIYLYMFPPYIGIPAVILAALISLSRLYVGVHYPTDIIGGFLIALIVSRIVYFALRKLYYKMDLKKKQKEVSYGEQ
ncbi:MAG: phosphatase PAP2 family protein [Lachnospiraceae bacterium]|nr:phosphatase PAP2 family protein [Lachnospiraceae bacterium]